MLMMLMYTHFGKTVGFKTMYSENKPKGMCSTKVQVCNYSNCMSAIDTLVKDIYVKYK